MSRSSASWREGLGRWLGRFASFKIYDVLRLDFRTLRSPPRLPELEVRRCSLAELSPAPPDGLEWIRASCRGRSEVHGYVATIAGRPVAWVVYIAGAYTYPRSRIRVEPDPGEVLSVFMYTDPQHRGRGIAGLLRQAATQDLIANGVAHRGVAVISRKNLASLATQRRAGAVRTGSFRLLRLGGWARTWPLPEPRAEQP